jgi:DNA-binding transcriptional MocR family regulator
VDDHGVVPESLDEAMHLRPRALYLQNRAHNPLGVGLSRDRAEKLAAVLEPSETVIVEDDHAGDISVSELVSLGAYLPDRTVLIRSYSKSHGPDLRLAAVAGTGAIVVPLANRRLLGPGWSSRLLQSVLAEALVDVATTAAVEHARLCYAERRERFVAELEARGVTTSGRDGINLWVEVDDEQTALVALATRGIGATPGAPFLVDGAHGQYLRLTVGLVRERFAELAGHVAAAALPTASRSRNQ